MTPAEITTTLAAHRAWLARGRTGEGRADLRDADLRGAYLSDAYLRGADLRDADLRGAYLSDAVLSGADLSGAVLSGTCLDPAATAPPITDEQITAAGLRVVIIDGEEWLVGTRSRRSLHVGSTDYSEPGEYVAPWLSVDAATECHPGIYLGGAAATQGEDRIEARTRRAGAVYVSPERGVRCRVLVRDEEAAAEGQDA